MAIYIITYDLREPGQHYDSLIERIKNYGNWAKLGYSCFLIETDDTAVEIRDNLSMALDGNDKLYVGVANAPAAWTGLSENVSQWIKEKL